MPIKKSSLLSDKFYELPSEFAEQELSRLREKLCDSSTGGYVPDYATSIIENEQCDIDSVREALAQNFLVQILKDMDMLEITTEDDRRKHIRRFGATVRIGPSYK